MVGHTHHHGSPNTVATEPTSERSGPAHGHKAKRGLAFFLVFVNMAFFALTLALASYMFDEWVEGALGPRRIFSELNPAGRPALATMAMTFLSGAVGLATMIMAAVHGKKYSEGARMASLGSNLISFALVCLAAGFSIKTLAKGHTGDKYVSIAITIAAFNILLVLTMLAYLLSLGLFKNKDEYHHNRYPATTAALPPHHHKHAAGYDPESQTTATQAPIARA